MLESTTTTDAIVFAVLLFFGFCGWQKGLLRSILGPVSRVACFVLALLYYQKTQIIFISIGIVLFGPWIVNTIVSLVHHLLLKAAGKKPKISMLSRFSGMLISLLWSGVLVLLLVFAIAMMPLDAYGLRAAKADLIHSQTFLFLSENLKSKFPAITQVESKGSQLDFSQLPEEMKETEEFKSLINDKRVQEMMADEEVMGLIQKRNVVELVNHPKFQNFLQSVIQDPNLTKNFMGFYKKINEARLPQGAETELDERLSITNQNQRNDQ